MNRKGKRNRRRYLEKLEERQLLTGDFDVLGHSGSVNQLEFDPDPEPIEISQLGLEVLDPREVAEGLILLASGEFSSEQEISPLNLDAADTTNTDALGPSGSYNLDGSGYRVGVWDAGGVFAHNEFSGRVSYHDAGASACVTPANCSQHATHVAGTIGASGLNPSAQGMAGDVSIESYDWTNDLSELAAAASAGSANPMIVSNHSYGSSTLAHGNGWAPSPLNTTLGQFDYWAEDRRLFAESPLFGKYWAKAASIDSVLHNNQDFVSVWAAGNDRANQFHNAHSDGTYVTYLSSGSFCGTSISPPGVYVVDPAICGPLPINDGDFDNLGPSQSAKNIITVGAVGDVLVDPYNSSQISTTVFSSYGPTDDGRIKPDLVANGDQLNSTLTGNNYGSASGTSMAAPNVSGTAALLVEHFESTYAFRPKSATTKGLMIHTAADAGNLGPDYSYGWGLLDAEASAQFLTAASSGTTSRDWFVEQHYTGAKQSWNVTADGGSDVKATIVWTDAAGQAHPRNQANVTSSALVNDLDIWLTDSAGNTYHAWRLDPSTPAAPATSHVSSSGFNPSMANRLDNVEQIVIPTPAAGTQFTLHVGNAGKVSDQRFSLFFTGAAETSEELGSIHGMKFDDCNGDGKRTEDLVVATGGRPDTFVTSDGAELTNPRAGLAAEINQPNDRTDYDADDFNQYFIESLYFDADASCAPITSSYLRITARPIGESVSNDSLHLFSGTWPTSLSETFSWEALAIANSSMSWTDNNFPTGATFDLPITTAFANMIGNGRLDIYSQDDTAIDSIELHVITEDMGIPGWPITATGVDQQGNPITVTTTTMADGHYWIEELPPGIYTVSEENITGWVQTAPQSKTYQVELGPGEIVNERDFGNRLGGSVHGFKFLDVDGDGRYNEDIDEPLPHIKISLYGDADGDGTSELVLAHTDENGEFWFTGLFPGEYIVSEAPEDYIPTTHTSIGVNVGRGEELVAFEGQAMLGPDQKEVLIGRELMFGNQLPSSIHGFKFKDVDEDGKYNPEIDEPWSDVWIGLWGDADGDGSPELLSTSTNSDGEFWYTGLHPGKYSVAEVPPAGSVPTTPTSVDVSVGVGEELVAFPGQAMLLPGQTEIVVGSKLMFGNADRTGSIHGQKFEQRLFRTSSLGGRRDNYDPVVPDPASLHPDFQTHLGSLPLVGYDTGQVDVHFADSLQGLPDDILGISLQIGLKPLGSMPTNDSIVLGVLGSGAPQNSVSQLISTVVSSPWTTAAFPNGVVETLQVPTSLLSTIDFHDRLDIRVQDDTAVDFVRACVTHRTLTGLNNWTIDLIGPNGNVVDTQTTMAMNGENGHYWFENVPSGNYTVRERIPSSNRPFSLNHWSPVSPSNGEQTVTLMEQQQLQGIDFVNSRLTAQLPCWSPVLSPGPFEELAADFESEFVDTVLGPEPIRLGFDDVNGSIEPSEFLESHGVVLSGNFDNKELVGISPEGTSPLPQFDGYDGSYRENGNNVFVLSPNNEDPFELTFERPVAAVGSFVATGVEGDISTLTVEAFDEDGELIEVARASVNQFANEESKEGFWGISVATDAIKRVVVRNDNETGSGTAAAFDDLVWARKSSIQDAIPGDFNGDSLVNVRDIDLLALAIQSGDNDPMLDLSGDGLVNESDKNQLIDDALETYLGDTDLDGAVMFSDFLVLSQNFGVTNAGWAEGDFTCDGDVNFEDFLILSKNFGKIRPS